MTRSARGKTCSIGVCVCYGKDLFTLAFILFKPNGDVIVSQHFKDYQKLQDGTKWDPHVTYHGAVGIHHLVSYKDHWHRSNKQRLDTSFSGHEHVIQQGFSRESARQLGHPCIGFDRCVVVDSEQIDFKEERIQGLEGEICKTLPTACFHVDLIEPNRSDLAASLVQRNHSVIEQSVITDTFPWCVVTITRLRSG